MMTLLYVIAGFIYISGGVTMWLLSEALVDLEGRSLEDHSPLWVFFFWPIVIWVPVFVLVWNDYIKKGKRHD